MLPPPPRQDTVVATDSMTNPTLVKVRDAGVISPNLLPNIPGYEVLDRLGQGGMGRVFKARHLGLERLDAIKMLIIGASPQLIIRFMDEARAVARLNHPNIAQVYDTGEVDGHPYYAMELVEAGTLAQKLSGQPQEARWSAGLLKTLAQAVHYFHEQGIIHRDLKPSNVLMTTDGEPKIADFGLVKNMGSESQNTETGDIIGTPSYMSPEQASGMVKSIGPASDIYALGAILYECLTGRPPFQTPEGMQTLMLVITSEPVPPSQLVPKLPRDLNTICLKCLEKQPGRRYATAEALADDLGRYLEGDSIIARPVGRVEKTWKWCRRRPAWAALILVGLLSLIGFTVGFFWLTKAYADLSAAKKESDMHLRASSVVINRLALSYSKDLAPIPHTETIRRKGLDDARLIFEKLISFRPHDLESREQYVISCLQLAGIERTLGEYQRADDAYQRAAHMLDQMLQDSDNIDYRAQYLAMIVQRANLEVERGQADAGQEYLRQAKPLAEKLEQQLNNTTVLHSLADFHSASGLFYRRQQKLDEAEAECRQALACMERAIINEGTENSKDEDLANAHNNLGTILLFQLRFPLAMAEFDQAIKTLPQENHPRIKSSMAMFLSNEAVVSEQLKQWQKAAASYEQAAVIFKQLMLDFPSIPDYRFRWAKVKVNLLRGQVEHDVKKAKDIIAEVQPVLEQLVKDYPQQQTYRDQWKMLQTCKETVEYLQKEATSGKKP